MRLFVRVGAAGTAVLMRVALAVIFVLVTVYHSVICVLIVFVVTKVRTILCNRVANCACWMLNTSDGTSVEMVVFIGEISSSVDNSRCGILLLACFGV